VGRKTALVNAMIADGTGAKEITDGRLIIEDSKIVDVGERDSIRIPDDATTIDCSGKSVLPGLIDAHVHLSMQADDNPFTGFGRTKMSLVGLAMQTVASAKTTLDSGVTTVRDVGSLNLVTIELRNLINAGLLRGPRVLTCNQAIGITGGHGDDYKHSTFEGFRTTEGMTRFADSVEEAKKAVREQIRAGADWIKLYASGGALEPDPELINTFEYSLEELTSIAQEAKRGLRSCAAHCQPAEQIKNCVKAGIRTIEHGVFADTECGVMMKDHGVSHIPTMTVYYRFATMKSGLPASAIEAARWATEFQQSHVRQEWELGVNIGMGTDAGAPMVPHGTNSAELEMFTKCGLDPLDAIKACTFNSAKALGLEKKVGTLERGKQADILVLDGNILEDVKLPQDRKKIFAVFKDGER
jgi:imidazolonepropionase-like amidohydrolase